MWSLHKRDIFHVVNCFPGTTNGQLTARFCIFLFIEKWVIRNNILTICEGCIGLVWRLWLHYSHCLHICFCRLVSKFYGPIVNELLFLVDVCLLHLNSWSNLQINLMKILMIFMTIYKPYSFFNEYNLDGFFST